MGQPSDPNAAELRLAMTKVFVSGLKLQAEIGVYREELWRQVRQQPAQPEARR